MPPIITATDLGTEFQKVRPQLRSFLLRITTSADDTDDLVQDTYLRAHQHIGNFRGESSLKTWLFSIASNLGRDFLRNKKRWPENVTDICREATLSNPEALKGMIAFRTSSPQADFEIREHIAFCFTCIGKSLPLDQQVALLLKEVYDFKVSEIALIMDLTEGVVKHLLLNSRKKMTGIFDQRCSLISKQGTCHQCSELNGIFNPKHELQKELMKIEMAREAENRDREALFDLRMKIVQEIDPFESGAAKLQLLHLKHNAGIMDRFLEKN